MSTTPISEKDTQITLDFLKKQPENQYFERKGINEAGLKPTKLANEIIGMLNADGGVIALGISSEGEIQNLNDLDENLLDKYRMVTHDLIKPPACVDLEEITLRGEKLIFLYHIEQDYERVFSRKDNEEIYLRMSDENRKLNRDEARKLEYDNGIRKFEDEVCEDFDPQNFRKKALDYYKTQLNFEGNIEDLLLKRNLAIRKNGKILYKNSAIILFSEDPDKYIPSSYVRYVRYSGTTAKTGIEHNVTKDERFHEGVPRMIEVLKRFIYASLRDYYYLDMDTGKFVQISEYPQEAWLEGIVNALCHRSYNLQGNSIYIKHFDDRLEISNSGPLPAQVTVENIKTERFSRNPRVARVLADMKYVRELNEGVSRIYESMEKSMLAKPEYYDKNNTITLILRNKVAEHEKSISEDVMQKIEATWKVFNATERNLLRYLFVNHKATISELAKDIGVSQQAIRTYLKEFCKRGIIERHSEKIRDINALYTFKKS